MKGQIAVLVLAALGLGSPAVGQAIPGEDISEGQIKILKGLGEHLGLSGIDPDFDPEGRLPKRLGGSDGQIDPAFLRWQKRFENRRACREALAAPVAPGGILGGPPSTNPLIGATPVIDLRNVGKVIPMSGTLCARELILGDGTVLVTGGKGLDIVVHKLTIEGTAEIRSYDFDDPPSPVRPPRPAKSPGGGSHDPGPDTEGPGGGDQGADGGGGAVGVTGTRGAGGGNPFCYQPPIRILLAPPAVVSGRLRIDGRGVFGGPGGPGGAGGDGGNGQQGGRSVFKRTIFGVPYCDKGPGWGGRGGDGGDAGMGGEGGCGQNGASAIIASLCSEPFDVDGPLCHDPFQGDLSAFELAAVDLSAGGSGVPGPPGEAGKGGAGGWGGRGSTACQGEELSRKGQDGLLGRSSQEGVCGLPGVSGQFSSDLGLSPAANATLPAGPCRPEASPLCRSARPPGPGAIPASSCAERQVLQGLWEAVVRAAAKKSGAKVDLDSIDIPGAECPAQVIALAGGQSSPSPLQDSPTRLQWIRDLTFGFTQRPPEQPAQDCSQAAGIERSVCCLGTADHLNVSLECLESIPATNGAEAFAFGMVSYALFGAELARESLIVRPNATAALEPGATYIQWHGPAANGAFGDGSFLLTRLSAHLLERLSLIAAEILPKLPGAPASPVGSRQELRCASSGFSAAVVNWDADLAASYPLFVSTGSPVAIRRPPNSAAALGATLEMRAGTSATYLRVRNSRSCAVNTTCEDGTKNRCLRDGLTQFATRKLDPFPCSALEVNPIALRNQLNHPESAAIVAYGLYIMGVAGTYQLDR